MMAMVGRKALALTGALLGVWALSGCQVLGGGAGSDPDPAVYLSEARQRLDARSQSVYDGLGLAGEAQVNDIQSTGCYTTTWSLKEELNGLGMEHRWQIKDVAEADARSADRRMRERMRADGWEVAYDKPGSKDGVAGVNVRFKDPETKDSLNLSWWPTARSLSVRQYVNCTGRRRQTGCARPCHHVGRGLSGSARMTGEYVHDRRPGPAARADPERWSGYGSRRPHAMGAAVAARTQRP